MTQFGICPLHLVNGVTALSSPVKSEVVLFLSGGVPGESLERVWEMLLFGPEKTAFGKHPHLGSLVGVFSVAVPALLILYQQMRFPFCHHQQLYIKALENDSFSRIAFHYVTGAKFYFLFPFLFLFFK